MEDDRPDGESFTHAAQSLRALDFDRYAASLAIPDTHRGAVQAIWAFSAEVAATSERVSEPAPGEIRLQWWVDALEGEGHGSVSRNPVAKALQAALDAYELPAGPLVRLLAARRFDLYGDPMPDLAQFEGYAGETTSVLYQYAAMILSGRPAEDAADAAGHFGVAQALAGHLRAFGFNASRGRIFLPFSVFSAHGVSEAEILSGLPSERMDAALGQLREIAIEHLDKAQRHIRHLPKNITPAFAGAALIQPALKAEARRTGRAVFSSPPEIPAFVKLGRIALWRIRRGL